MDLKAMGSSLVANYRIELVFFFFAWRKLPFYSLQRFDSTGRYFSVAFNEIVFPTLHFFTVESQNGNKCCRIKINKFLFVGLNNYLRYPKRKN
jgi:hypothetical protein